jgi:hypothetical protein
MLVTPGKECGKDEERKDSSQTRLHLQHGFWKRERFHPEAFPIGKDHSGKEWQDGESGQNLLCKAGR